MSNWTPVEWASFLTALGTFLSVAVSAFGAFMAALAKIKSESNAKAIQQIHVATNSMKDALVAATGREGFTAGVKSEMEKTKPPQSNQGM